jgi:serine/threonine protein kinase
MIKFHSLGYLHRDLKSTNILLDNDFLHHICIFGGVYEYDQSVFNIHEIEAFFGSHTKTS